MKIAVVGAYGVGRAYGIDRAPGAGETIRATSSHDSHGGKGSNQAVAAARLGADVSLLTAIGRDDAGRAARELWASEGVDDSAVVVRDAPTMTGVILVEPSGENRIVISSGALEQLSPADVDAYRSTIAASDMLIVSLEIPLGVAFHAIAVAREAGVRVLLNPAPAATIPRDVLANVDVLTPNATEASAILGDSKAEPLAELRQLTNALIVQTLGADGAVIVDLDGAPRRVDAVRPERVVDTTGAGDSFTAALAVALLAGLPSDAAVAWAAAAGARTVQTPGVIPALPRRHDLPPLDTDGIRF